MKSLCLILLCVSLIGCAEGRQSHTGKFKAKVYRAVAYRVELPRDQRHWNYGGGSCVFASMASTLEHLGLSNHADWLTSRYGGGETAYGLHATLDSLGWDYVATTNGDVRVLDWADRTGRMAIVTFKSNHMCAFLGWQDGYAVVLDPNRIEELEYYPREKFLASWKSHGGWATALVATPLP